MREENRTGLRRGVVAGLYGAALMALTLAVQVTSWSDPDALLAYGTAVGLAFMAPLSFLGYMGQRDARRNDLG